MGALELQPFPTVQESISVAEPALLQFRTGYLDCALDNLGQVIRNGKKQLGELEFDTLVGTGLSGAIVVPPLALALKKSFVIVRKEQDGSHHNGQLVGTLGRSYIFVDDFISTGRTRGRVKSALRTYAPTSRYLGDYCYTSVPASCTCTYAKRRSVCTHRGIYYPGGEPA